MMAPQWRKCPTCLATVTQDEELMHDCSDADLARVIDIIRRSDVSDADRLVPKVEAAFQALKLSKSAAKAAVAIVTTINPRELAAVAAGGVAGKILYDWIQSLPKSK